MIDPQIALAASLFLGLLLVAAAVHKLREPRRFRAAVASYGLVPTMFLVPAAILIPVAEMFIGVALICPVTRAPAAMAAITLFSGYGALLAIAVMRGKDLADCGCSFTSQPVAGPWFPVVRNAALCLGGVLILSPPAPRSMTAFDFAQAMLAMASLALLYIAAEALGSARLWEKR